MSGKGTHAHGRDSSPNGSQGSFFNRVKTTDFLRSGKAKDPTASLRESNAKLEAQVSMWKAKYAALENYCELLESYASPPNTLPSLPSVASPQRRRYFEHFLLLGASNEALAQHAMAGAASSAGTAVVDAVKLLCFPSDPPLEKLEEFAFPAGAK